MPMKMEVNTARATTAFVGTKKEAPGRLSAEERKAHIEQVSEHELFVHQRRNEATLRDITGRAVCATKRALREPEAQADGRPAIPANWDQVFKPQLGSFMKFVLGRPDQFRVTEGSGPGFYTVENVAGNVLGQPPSVMGKAAKGGKGKAWGKGGGKDMADGGKGKVKGKGKGQDWNGSGKGKDWGKSKGKDKAPWAAVRQPTPAATAAPLPKGAQLLAQAAKEELAGLEDEEVEEETLGFEEDGQPAEDEEEEVEPEEDHAMDEEEEALQAVRRLASTEDEQELAAAAGPRHGNLISSLLAGGLGKKL